MPTITKKHAEDIAQKLENDEPKQDDHLPFTVNRRQERKHEVIQMKYDGTWIGSYNIRRGKPNQNHNFVAPQLHLSRDDVLEFARCPLSIDNYIDILEEKDVIGRSNT